MVNIFIFSSNCPVLQVEDKPGLDVNHELFGEQVMEDTQSKRTVLYSSSFPFSAQPPRIQDAFQCIIQSNLK